MLIFQTIPHLLAFICIQDVYVQVMLVFLHVIYLRDHHSFAYLVFVCLQTSS